MKTVEGIDDFASMHEVVTRYFTRRIEEEKPLPDLVRHRRRQGPAQRGARGARGARAWRDADRSASPSARKRSSCSAAASRCDCSRRSPALRVLQQARDEAHRFAITFQRKRRVDAHDHVGAAAHPGRRASASAGSCSQAFGSLQGVRDATPEAIAALPGFSRRPRERFSRRCIATRRAATHRSRSRPATVAAAVAPSDPPTDHRSREHLAPRMFRVRRTASRATRAPPSARRAGSRFSCATIRRARRATRVTRRAGTCGATRRSCRSRDGEEPVSLGEGAHADARAADARAARSASRRLWVKDEGLNPTGVVQGARHERGRHARARRSACRASSCRRRATPARRSPRTAPRRGFPVRVYAPRDDAASRFSTRSARSAPICSSSPGHIGDAGKQARAFAAESGYFDVSTLREPYRIEGKKTMGIELAEQLGWRLPTHIVYPTGGGTGLIGMWKVFAEMRDGGWLAEGRRIAAHGRRAGRRLRADRARVRARGADQRDAVGESRRRTRAGCAFPGPLGDRLILRALRESDGDAHAVSEDAIRDATLRLRARRGIDAAPEGGCALAVTEQLVARPDEFRATPKSWCSTPEAARRTAF